MIAFRRSQWILLVSGAVLLAATGCGSRSNLWPALDEESLNPSPDPRDPDPTDPDPTDPDPVEPSELCANFTLDYAAEPATVMLLVDGSGSMYEPIGTTTRWELVQEALFDEENGLVTELAPSARFGLVLYSSYDGFFGGASSCPIFETRPPELNSAERLRHLFGRSTPLAEGDTPTGEALDATVDFLLADPGQGPRYLILITDGLPDTCAVPDPQEGEPEALAAARRAFESGIETFVVGISSDIAPEHLQQMANVAQGAPLDAIWGEDPEAVQPIQADEQHEILAGQIKGVLGDVRSCTIIVSPDTDEQGSVSVDGSELTVDVDYQVERNALSLLGEACQQVLDDARILEVRLSCKEPG